MKQKTNLLPKSIRAISFSLLAFFLGYKFFDFNNKLAAKKVITNENFPFKEKDQAETEKTDRPPPNITEKSATIKNKPDKVLILQKLQSALSETNTNQLLQAVSSPSFKSEENLTTVLAALTTRFKQNSYKKDTHGNNQNQKELAQRIFLIKSMTSIAITESRSTEIVTRFFIDLLKLNPPMVIQREVLKTMTKLNLNLSDKDRNDLFATTSDIAKNLAFASDEDLLKQSMSLENNE